MRNGPGTGFSQYELRTTDTDAARAFHAGLLEPDVLVSPLTGSPAGVFASYAVARVRAQGGAASEPLSTPNGDRAAACEDPQGAVFGLYRFG